MRKRPLALLLACLVITACADVEPVHPGTGTTLEKSGLNYDQVWDATSRSIERTYTITRTNKSRGELEVERASGPSLWKEGVTVYIAPVNGKKDTYSVEVVSHKAMKRGMTPDNFVQIVFESVKAELDLIDDREGLKRRLGV